MKEWQYLAPFPNEGKTKKVKNAQGVEKTYHWCTKATGAPSGNGCNKWVIHKPKECKGTSRPPPPNLKKAVDKRNAAIKALKAKQGGTVAVNTTEIAINDDDDENEDLHVEQATVRRNTRFDSFDDYLLDDDYTGN